MKLYEGNLYWDKTVEIPFRFGKVTEAKETKILIAGGGISGNLCAYVMSALGMDVTIVEKNKMGKGSSLANTGLLQYRSDRMLCEFIDDIGEEQGRLFYQMCLEAMDHLTAVNELIGNSTEYRLKDTIYYASTEKDADKLSREYDYLTQYGFPVEFLDGSELRKRYKINKSCALRTWHDADVNPYKFIQALIRKNLEQGVHYFEDTELDIDNIEDSKIFTVDGHPIIFEYLILTTGYSKIYSKIKDKIIINRTYAFVSAPLEKFLWRDNVMIWETKKPYLYFRTTQDNRIIAGGLDEDTDILEQDQAKTLEKSKELAGQIETIFPHLAINIDYAWNAIFYGTKDGLPFIGEDPDRSNICYLLGYEGNGMCYSMAGALILRDYIMGNPNLYQAIVNVERILPPSCSLGSR